MLTTSSDLRCKYIIPEVVQTSSLDCGPAALASMLGGFEMPTSYAWLRDACQTGLNGTSLDDLERVANALGLEAESVLLPFDHVVLAQRVTSIVVVRMPGGEAHFVVAWRRHGSWVQLMDPSVGRRWRRAQDVERSLSVHMMSASVAEFRAYAQQDLFRGGLETRLQRLGDSAQRAACRVDSALQRDAYRSLATLDAGTRLLESLARTGVVRRGAEAQRTLERVCAEAKESPFEQNPIPPVYWMVAPEDTCAGEERLRVRGTALLLAKGVGAQARTQAREAHWRALAPGLEGSPTAPQMRPVTELVRLLRADGLAPLALILLYIVLAAGSAVLEALVLRSLLYAAQYLQLLGQRLLTMLALAGALGLSVVIQVQAMSLALRAGRKLELRMRLALLSKLPNLPSHFFRSRQVSDIAERCHSATSLRGAPNTLARAAHLCMQIVVIVVAIGCVDPSSEELAMLIGLACLLFPLLGNRLTQERDLRVQTHAGSLCRFYLDALRGQLTIRAHSAERAMRRLHEQLLAEWARASYALQRASVVVEGSLALCGFALGGSLVEQHIRRHGIGGDGLLVAYWALTLPALGGELAIQSRQFPYLRNLAARALEPILAGGRGTAYDALADDRARSRALTAEDRVRSGRGVAIELEGVTVLASGRPVLEDLNIAIAPGTHIAIVGASGAGKSSLLGLFLGVHTATAGEIRCDGEALTQAKLEGLRHRCAWLDPTVYLWNRSVLDNVCYSMAEPSAARVAELFETAQLLEVAQELAEGLQTSIGEAGNLVSGGEGQRIRFARALGRANADLVLLDEPFRGLDRARRTQLLGAARRHWQRSTLLCVTHDIAETEAFDRVLVLERGRIAEFGTPAQLRDRRGKYERLLRSETALLQRIQASQRYRYLSIDAADRPYDNKRD